MSENKSPSGVDRVVGQRLRWRRRELRLTQEQLGERLGLTFQQVQKYEKGVNRISAGRLFEMASQLSVPIGYFYEGADEVVSSQLAVQESAEAPELPLIDAQSMELIAAFQKIKDPDLRRSLLNTIRAAASASANTNQTD
ncbi:MAG: helix-turn-helix transcriptional regulator [Pseudomonadota bacterium]